ncbi:MAG: hypothetical protein NC930_07485 [Candidatus Omnitrophica bacterium]|nr:hypothetical protein [Candidatus Omnitrophota bacterium]
MMLPRLKLIKKVNPKTAIWNRPFWFSKLFLGVLILKAAASFFLASSYLTQLFTPFINWFVWSGFKNPWDFFYNLNLTKSFPYPTVMLWTMTLPRVVFAPLLSQDWHAVTALHLFVMRIPLLAFDILLLTQFLNLFPTQQKKVLIIYWCSPIVFFINYIHGQLDIVPTALFFTTVFLLIRQQYLTSVLLFAIAAASKTHLFISLPFIVVFLYRKKIPIRRLVLYVLACLAFYLILVTPYLRSEAFRQMVFNSPEQRRLFDFFLAISPTLNLMVCPTVVTLLFIKFASYKKLNREILLMFLGIVFAILVVFVPPMPGWFMWSLPFLIYFYLSNKEYSRAPFILYNAIYVIYFLFFFEKDPAFLNQMMPHLPVKDLALSVTMASVGFIAFWMFQLGVKKNEELKILEAPFLIGIGGDSGSGKHTLLRVLRNLVGKSRSIPMFGDDFHKWERGNENWQIYTHLNPTASRLHDSMDLAIALKDGKNIELGHYDHTTGKFSDPTVIESNKFIFFVGLHPFYLKKMRSLIHMKIFIDTDEPLRKYWKIQRDVLKRGYERSKVLAQITSRQEDRLKYIEPQKQFADLIIRYESEIPLNLDRPSAARIPLKTTYTLDNSINLEDLVENLSYVPALHVEHYGDISIQQLEVTGSITAREVMNIAYQLKLNFDELFINPRGGWLRDYHGITQLVFLLLYNHHLKS